MDIPRHIAGQADATFTTYARRIASAAAGGTVTMALSLFAAHFIQAAEGGALPWLLCLVMAFLASLAGGYVAGFMNPGDGAISGGLAGLSAGLGVTALASVLSASAAGVAVGGIVLCWMWAIGGSAGGRLA